MAIRAAYINEYEMERKNDDGKDVAAELATNLTYCSTLPILLLLLLLLALLPMIWHETYYIP